MKTWMKVVLGILGILGIVALTIYILLAGCVDLLWQIGEGQ